MQLRRSQSFHRGLPGFTDTAPVLERNVTLESYQVVLVAFGKVETKWNECIWEAATGSKQKMGPPVAPTMVPGKQLQLLSLKFPGAIINNLNKGWSEFFLAGSAIFPELSPTSWFSFSVQQVSIKQDLEKGHMAIDSYSQNWLVCLSSAHWDLVLSLQVLVLAHLQSVLTLGYPNYKGPPPT